MNMRERLSRAAPQVLGEESYFASCPRDDKGHCTAGGGESGTSSGSQGLLFSPGETGDIGGTPVVNIPLLRKALDSIESTAQDVGRQLAAGGKQADPERNRSALAALQDAIRLIKTSQYKGDVRKAMRDVSSQLSKKFRDAEYAGDTSENRGKVDGYLAAMHYVQDALDTDWYGHEQERAARSVRERISRVAQTLLSENRVVALGSVSRLLRLSAL